MTDPIVLDPMTDRGLAALEEALQHATDDNPMPDTTLGGTFDQWQRWFRRAASNLLGEHGVFLPDGHSGCDVDIAYQAGLEDASITGADREADLLAEIERLRAALSAFVTWWDAAPFVTTDEAIAEHIDVLRAALARTGGIR